MPEKMNWKISQRWETWNSGPCFRRVSLLRNHLYQLRLTLRSRMSHRCVTNTDCRLADRRPADLQTCRLQTCRPQTCRLADLQTCRHVRNSQGEGDNCPPHAYIKESTCSWNKTVSMPEKILICLNRGREESVGNDDVMKTENSEGTT